jgi:hypothetical protein
MGFLENAPDTLRPDRTLFKGVWKISPTLFGVSGTFSWKPMDKWKPPIRLGQEFQV